MTDSTGTLARIRARLGDDLGTLERSIAVYYGDPARDAAMDRLYAGFVKAGDLAFDIGSHVGDRIGSFRRLGARVVALEPQPACAAAIRQIYADDPSVTVVEAACADKPGSMTLYINSANPTVSSGSKAFLAAADGAPGWEGQVWDGSVDVQTTTLDLLIERHGMPAFIKIDVEGFEDIVLGGLTRAPAAVSFEFTTIQRDVAMRCLDRIEQIDRYRYTFALGESQSLLFEAPVDVATLREAIMKLPDAANSGDVYAIRSI
jgi:FkbM family methyltransferase